MKIGTIYKCIWHEMGYTGIDQKGWEMLLFLRTEVLTRTDGAIVTNYRFYDILASEERLLDENLAQQCEEIDTEET